MTAYHIVVRSNISNDKQLEFKTSWLLSNIMNYICSEYRVEVQYLLQI